MRILTAFLILAIDATAAGCAGATAPAAPSAPPSAASSLPSALAASPSPAASTGTLLHLAAVVKAGIQGPGKFRWNTTDLRAPAGESFEIKYVNLTDDVHNLVITDAAGKELFHSPDAMSEKTFQIPALAPGSYPFVCTIHAENMKGTLTVG